MRILLSLNIRELSQLAGKPLKSQIRDNVSQVLIPLRLIFLKLIFPGNRGFLLPPAGLRRRQSPRDQIRVPCRHRQKF